MRAWLGLVLAVVLSATAGVAYAGEPTYGVVTSEYNLGDEAITLLGGVMSELRAKVYEPKRAPGKRPLILFLHGFHEACYGGDGVQRWPCAPDQRPVPSFRGYDAPGIELARHGYVVISISSNAVNRNVGKTLDAGTRLRGELVLAHLDLWKHSNRVDLDNVGLMGHSRGGEGVVAATLANAARPHPYGIKAVLPLASTSATRQALPGVALNLLSGYCDGDVYDLQGQHLYDDARATDDDAPKSSVLLMGANHNFFNSEWTPGQAEAPATDDWGFNPDDEPCGTATATRLTAVEQQAAGRVYISGFFRWILGGDETQGKLFDGSNPKVTSHSPDRHELARFDKPVSTSGDLTATVCTGSPSWLPDPNPEPFCTENEQPDRFPHWVPSFFLPAVPTPAITALQWTSRNGVLRIPVKTSKQYDVLTFRAAADPDRPTQDLTVRLIDNHGKYRDVAVSQVGDALTQLPGKHEDSQPKTLLRTVRIPLKTRALKAVELRTDRTSTGRIFISDLALSTPSRGRTTINQLPRISVADAAPIAEGNSTTKVDFTVTLSRSSHQPITVHAETAGFTADPEIVRPLSTTITFAPGETRKTVAVQIHGNTTAQPDQDFKLALAVPRNAITDDAWATGKVLDDDTGPSTQLHRPEVTPRGGPGYRGM
ncbi:hypothetical protein ACFTSF_04455 [Kribbella sp. NPDC056951]|uniref:hypothetical protein n=1 Tax=Kribbella sp. NPDC056951 TaxID=3345978 RepID=UPI00364566A7